MKKAAYVFSKSFRLFFLSGFIFCFTLTIKPGVSHHERKKAPVSIEGVAPPSSTYYCSRDTQMPEGKFWNKNGIFQRYRGCVLCCF